MTLYRSIFKQAFVTAWQHKYLWFFGVFATLLASNFEIELVNRFLNRGETLFAWQRWAALGIFNGQAWSNLLELARTDTSSFISLLVFILILIALFVALLWISVVSQIALVSNANKAVASGKLTVAERRHDSSVGFQEGRKYFWKVLLLNLLVRLAVYGLAALTLIPALFRTSPGVVDNLLYLVFFIVFIAIALSLALIAKYAIAALVIKRQTLGESLVSSWNLYWNNWLLSLEMAFILFGLSVAASIVILLGLLIVAIPFALLYLLSFAVGTFWIYIIFVTLAIIASLGLIIIGGSIITVVQTTAWVSLYNQLLGRTQLASKLERTFGAK